MDKLVESSLSDEAGSPQWRLLKLEWGLGTVTETWGKTNGNNEILASYKKYEIFSNPEVGRLSSTGARTVSKRTVREIYDNDEELVNRVASSPCDSPLGEEKGTTLEAC